MTDFTSYVISWNITQRCNLVCQHCYIDAIRAKASETLPGELSTEECFRVIDQIVEVNPNALLILTGGEPLLRPDVFEIASHASSKALWVVVGTNGVLIEPKVVERMKEADIKGVSLSLDSLDPQTHDAFRGVQGAWQNTVNGAQVLRDHNLPFLIQTTLGEHNKSDIFDIARKAHALGARVFNLYFLVPTGRGKYISNITPEEYEDALHRLLGMQKEFQGQMLVNAKCAPHYQRVLYETDPASPFIKGFSQGAGGCPAGTHYLGIRPSGDMSPCPYLPVYGGNLREKSFKDIWENSEVFVNIRARKKLGGRCGDCEFAEMCGGCRARAYGSTDDYMAEDPWCVYQPGKYGGKPIQIERITYGVAAKTGLHWTSEAEARLQNVPAFVRGMVVKAVEAMAEKEGVAEVSGEFMEQAKSKALGGRIGGVPFFKS